MGQQEPLWEAVKAIEQLAHAAWANEYMAPWWRFRKRAVEHARQKAYNDSIRMIREAMREVRRREENSLPDLSKMGIQLVKEMDGGQSLEAGD